MTMTPTTSKLLYEDYASIVTQALDAARHTIDLQMFALQAADRRTLGAYQQLFHAIEQAPLRGVRCRALLSAAPNSRDTSPISHVAIARLSMCGWVIRYPRDGRTHHAKTVIIDDRHLVTGSHNWTAQSLCRNDECSLSTLDATLLTQARRRFLINWHKSACRSQT